MTAISAYYECKKSMSVANPYSGEVIGFVSVASDDDVQLIGNYISAGAKAAA